jgi:hypothetical protein
MIQLCLKQLERLESQSFIFPLSHDLARRLCALTARFFLPIFISEWGLGGSFSTAAMIRLASARGSWGLGMAESELKDFQDFCYHIGLALVTWQDVEEAHFKLFFKLIGAPNGEIASLAYHSIEGFQQRHAMIGRMIDAFFKNTKQDEVVKQTWGNADGLQKRLKAANLDRNKLAHYSWKTDFVSETHLATGGVIVKFSGPRLQASAYNSVSRASGYTPDKPEHNLDIAAIQAYTGEFLRLAVKLDDFQRGLNTWPLEPTLAQVLGLPPKYLEGSPLHPLANKTSSDDQSSGE